MVDLESEAASLRDAAGETRRRWISRRFDREFTDEPGVVARSSGCSRWCSAAQPDAVGALRLHQDLQTLLRCHIAAFEALGGVPRRSSTTA
jgi:hypothetical protein